MARFELIPQAIEVLPNNRQAFRARALPPPPMWTSLTSGLVQADFSLRLSLSGAALVEGSGAHHLMSGVGAIEWAMDNLSIPSSTGVLQWTVFHTATTPWEYRVLIKVSTIEIRDQAGTLITTINRTVAAGDRFKIEISNGFRLYINNVLQHSLTTFASAITYPARYTARLTLPVVGVSGLLPTIPAPLLSGNWQLRPVVEFTAPTHGSLSSAGPSLAAEFFNGSVPGQYELIGKIDPGVDIWMEDSVPTGASQSTGGGDAWTFVSTNPVPQTGALCHKSSNIAGQHFHAFDGASATLQVNPGDILYCWVFPDTTNPTSEIMFQWKASDATAFEHRAYWGANSVAFGTDGTPSRRFMGALPPAGQWTRLEVPASLVDLEGRVLIGKAFILFDGVCSFDQAGKIPNLQNATALITIPPLQIVGEIERTVQPGAQTRILTNYDRALISLISWSALSGGGSFTQGEFTAPEAPGLNLVRATASVGNQVADVALNVPAVITPEIIAVAPGDQIDFNTNMLAMPVFLGAGAKAEGTGAIIPALPAGIQPGDILLLPVESANEAVATPTDWGAVADSPQGTGTGGGTTATRLTALWKRATAIESAPTIADPGDHAIGQILAFRGCIATGNPWDVTSGDTGGSSTAVSIPGDTTTVPNTLVVVAVAHQTDTLTPQVSAFTNADLANLTEITDIATDQGNGGGFAVATGQKAAAGPYGATAATLANASVQGRMSIALKPAVPVWSASIGSIDSSSGIWTAPSLAGQTALISVTNGTYTVTAEIAVLELFPFNKLATPWEVDYRKRVLISEADDSTRTSRIKSPAKRSFEINLTDCGEADLSTVRDFWDRHHPGVRFIWEDPEEEIRLVLWTDSDLRWRHNENGGIDFAFRVKEA